jgi:hypothetical protein
VSPVAIGASILIYITVTEAMLATANLRRLLENHMEEEESGAWSSADVLSQTIHKLDNLGLRHELLSEWYDINTANDLERLQSQRMNSEVAMKNTFALLNELTHGGRL